MNIKKIHINFQNIINGSYRDSEEILHIYSWLINLGHTCEEQNGWNRYGLHQSFHGYSYNNEKRQVYWLGSNWNKVIYDGFVRLLCKTNHHKVVKDFLIKERIELGKTRKIQITEDEPNYSYFKELVNDRFDNYGVRELIDHITTAYKGLELKKELFHPDYDIRVRPRILNNVVIGTNHGKWYAKFVFSFENFDYEPGWDKEFSQQPNEHLRNFFNRVICEIDAMILPSDSCNNCPLWQKSNHHGNKLRHGFRGLCKRRDCHCGKSGVVEYESILSESKKDNALYDSIVFPYFQPKRDFSVFNQAEMNEIFNRLIHEQYDCKIFK